jgi:hypothetical protein
MSEAMDRTNRLLAESRAMLEALDPELWLETSPVTESVVEELRATFERLERDITDLRERVTRLENATRT